MSFPSLYLARLRALAVALALAAPVALGLGGVGAPAVRAMGTLTACRYDDIPTTPRAYSDWSITLVDTILRVPSTYVPPDLVSTAAAGLKGTGQVRQLAIADLTAMAAAAKANGTPIAVQSAYRSYAQQKTTFDYWVSIDGYKGALKVSARPGHSEHQLGLAIDFRSDSGGPPWEGSDWALSPPGAWMRAHAWTFGWVMSYQKNDYAKVCYSYEPWHYRYVGRELAKLIHESGLTTREYLWANFTTAKVPALPSGGSPSPNPTGTPGPSDSAAPPASPEGTGAPGSLAPLEPTAPPSGSPPPVASPSPTALPTPSGATFGDAGPVVIAMVAVAAVALLGGWWFTSRARRR